MSEGTKNIVAAMKAHGVRKVVACLSGERRPPDAFPPLGNTPPVTPPHRPFVSPCPHPVAFLLWDLQKVPPRLLPVTEDHIRMHRVLQDSGLDCVAVMPPHIAGAWGHLGTRGGTRGDKGGGLKVSWWGHRHGDKQPGGWRWVAPRRRGWVVTPSWWRWVVALGVLDPTWRCHQLNDVG